MAVTAGSGQLEAIGEKAGVKHAHGLKLRAPASGINSLAVVATRYDTYGSVYSTTETPVLSAPLNSNRTRG